MAGEQRPLRTLLFSTLYPSSVRPSNGIFVETRLRELLKSGEVVTKVVAPVPWFPSARASFGAYAQFARTPRRETRNGIDVLHPRYPLIPKLGMNLAPYCLALGALPAIRKLQREGFDFDLIDAHYFYPDGVAAAMLARYLHKPLVITARGSDISELPRYTLPRKMIQWAASQAQVSISVCRALADELAALGVAREKLLVLRNGVDLLRFHPISRQAARAELGLPNIPTLISVGNLIELKGHHLVIQALADLANCQLLIVGGGPAESMLKHLAEHIGVADRVRFVGRIDQEQLYKYYSAADILTLASSREGWANVLLEAMACGTPVLATRVWGTPEVVAEAAAGALVEERSSAGFSAALSSMLAKPPDRDAVRKYAEKFDWADTTHGQIHAFKDAIRHFHTMR